MQIKNTPLSRWCNLCGIVLDGSAKKSAPNTPIKFFNRAGNQEKNCGSDMEVNFMAHEGNSLKFFWLGVFFFVLLA